MQLISRNQRVNITFMSGLRESVEWKNLSTSFKKELESAYSRKKSQYGISTDQDTTSQIEYNYEEESIKFKQKMDQDEILLRNSSLSKPSIDIDEEKERHGTENYEAN